MAVASCCCRVVFKMNLAWLGCVCPRSTYCLFSGKPIPWLIFYCLYLLELVPVFWHVSMTCLRLELSLELWSKEKRHIDIKMPIALFFLGLAQWFPNPFLKCMTSKMHANTVSSGNLSGTDAFEYPVLQRRLVTKKRNINLSSFFFFSPLC